MNNDLDLDFQGHIISYSLSIYDPQITPPQISAKCVIPNINYLEDYGQGHMASLSKLMN